MQLECEKVGKVEQTIANWTILDTNVDHKKKKIVVVTHQI